MESKSKLRGKHVIYASTDTKVDQQRTARDGAGPLKSDTSYTPHAKRTYSPGNANYTFKEREKGPQGADINQLIAEYERDAKPPGVSRPPKASLL